MASAMKVAGGLVPLVTGGDEDRRERPEGAVGHADQGAAGERERHAAVKAAEVDPPRRGLRRLRRRGEGNRHDGEADAERRQREGLEQGGVGEAEGELAGNQSGPADDQVDGEDTAAVLVRGSVVQPALDRHVDAGEAEADAHPQRDPGRLGDRESVAEHPGRGQAGKAREGADVPDPADQPR
jgi:hypothetical protein